MNRIFNNSKIPACFRVFNVNMFIDGPLMLRHKQAMKGEGPRESGGTPASVGREKIHNRWTENKLEITVRSLRWEQYRHG